MNDGYEITDEHSFQIQASSKTMPEYPMSSVTGTVDQLRKTAGNPLHIYGRWYRSHGYTIGLDLGTISGAGFICLSITPGNQLSINFKD